MDPIHRDGEGSALGRRRFLQTALAAGAGATVLGGAIAPPGADAALQAPAPQVRKGRPRVGCVSWCFHSFAAGADPEPAIDVMGELGFEGTDLILTARDDIKGFWTEAKIGAIRSRLERQRLTVAQFVLFQPVVEGLSSLDADERRRNLDYFEAGCRIGKQLGAPIIDIVAPWPRELRRPGGGYLPRHYEVPEPKPGEKFHIDIAAGFDWDDVWKGFVDTVKACLERVKAQGLKLSIEHHTHTLVPEAASFLRLWEAIGDPALGDNLDTGWTLLGREYPPLAIHKTRRVLMNVHARDIDGRMRDFVHVGEGVMDFKAVAETLVAIGYDGFVSIEQDKHPGDMKETCRRFVSIMKQHLGA